MNVQPPKLDYFISIKQDFLVVSFIGSMNKNTAAVIEKCREEVIASPARFVVLNFHDVIQLEPGAVPSIVRLELAVREKPGELQLCFLHPHFLKFLHDSGAIRPSEVSDNLLNALQSFSPALRKAA